MKRKKKNEPDVIRAGSAVVKVYETPTGNYPAWTVVHFFQGKRIRKKFSDKAAALDEAQRVATSLNNGEVVAGDLSAEDRIMYGRLVELAKPTGKRLDELVADAVEAWKLVPDVPFRVMAKQYAAQRKSSESPMVSKIAEEFETALKQDGRGSRHVESIRSRLKTFSDAFQCSIGSISGVEIDNWLRKMQSSKGWSGRTRNHYRAAISNLISYAKRKKYLPHDWVEFLSVTKATEEDGEVIIYTPEEGQKIMDGADKELIPYHALSNFAGARQSEIVRSDWKNINFEAKIFHTKGKVRTAGDRIIPLSDNCIAWLKPHAKKSGPICSKYVYKRLAKIKGWKINAPRRSFISYRLAITKNINQVSDETGTSVATLRKRYRRPVPLAEAEKWFSIVPKVSQRREKKPENKKAENEQNP